MYDSPKATHFNATDIGTNFPLAWADPIGLEARWQAAEYCREHGVDFTQFRPHDPDIIAEACRRASCNVVRVNLCGHECKRLSSYLESIQCSHGT